MWGGRTGPAPCVARAGTAGPRGSGARRADPAPHPAKGGASYNWFGSGKANRLTTRAQIQGFELAHPNIFPI